MLVCFPGQERERQPQKCGSESSQGYPSTVSSHGGVRGTGGRTSLGCCQGRGGAAPGWECSGHGVCGGQGAGAVTHHVHPAPARSLRLRKPSKCPRCGTRRGCGCPDALEAAGDAPAALCLCSVPTPCSLWARTAPALLKTHKGSCETGIMVCIVIQHLSISSTATCGNLQSICHRGDSPAGLLSPYSLSEVNGLIFPAPPDDKRIQRHPALCPALPRCAGLLSSRGLSRWRRKGGEFVLSGHSVCVFPTSPGSRLALQGEVKGKASGRPGKVTPGYPVG